MEPFQSLASQWLIAGVVLVAIEALGIPGVGFLFAGLGALTVGIALQFQLIAPDLSQWALLCVASAFWTLILWVPLKKFRISRQSHSYRNMVGDTVYIGSTAITKAEAGEATWSGTIMKAQLAPDASVDMLEPGSAAIIADVAGNTLIVKPKS